MIVPAVPNCAQDMPMLNTNQATQDRKKSNLCFCFSSAHLLLSPARNKVSVAEWLAHEPLGLEIL